MGAGESALAPGQAAAEFAAACRRGDAAKVERLLALRRPGCGDRKLLAGPQAYAGMLQASVHGRAEAVRVILKFSGQNRALADLDGAAAKMTTSRAPRKSSAAEHGGSRARLLHSLQGSFSVNDLAAWLDPGKGNSEVLRRACNAQHVEVARVLLKDGRVDPTVSDQYCIRIACKKGDLDLVRLLLQHPAVDPTVLDDDAFRAAAAFGHAEVCRELLAWRRAPADAASPVASDAQLPSRVNPATQNNYALRVAASYGHWDICKILLGCEGCNPAVEDDMPLRLAAKGGHARVVQGLLQDPRVSVSDSFLVDAAAIGSAECVRLLLEDGRADPTSKQFQALRCAYPCNHVETIILLLNDERVTPDKGVLSRMLSFASEAGEDWLVCMLLSHPRHRENVDIHASSDAPLRQAVRKDRAEVVKILLREGADPAAQQQYAIRKAAARGNLNIVELLLFHPRVDASFALRSVMNDTVFTAILRSKRAQVSIGVDAVHRDSRVAAAYELLLSDIVQSCRDCLTIFRSSRRGEHDWSGVLSLDLVVRVLAMAYGHKITASVWSHDHAFRVAQSLLTHLIASGARPGSPDLY